MSRLFHFRTREISGLPEWHVVFSSADDFDPTEFRDAHFADVTANGRPDVILFLVREDRHQFHLRKIRTLVRDTAEWRIDPTATPIVVVGYDARGSLGKVNPAGGIHTAVNTEVFDKLKHSGLCQIFRKRDGLLKASGDTHFVHPSRKHSLAFIRTANLLVDGNETTFIAMCLLKHIEPDLEYLWIDTSSIASVAFAAVALRMSMDAKFRRPVVSSFRSWDAINTDFAFPATPRQLLAISASTSGKLARELARSTNIPRERIVTLFSLASASDVVELCNLGSDPAFSTAAHPPVTSEYSDVDCRYCKAGWTTIQFLGDQFLADSIQYEAVDIRVNRDAKEQRPRTRFMSRYHGFGALMLRAVEGAETANDFHIDADRLVEAEAFRTLLDSALVRYAPAGRKTLVCDENEGAFSARILTQLSTHGDVVPSVITPAQLYSGAASLDQTSASVFVTAAAIATGNAWERVSRDLRQPFEDKPRTYLAGFSKHAHLMRTERMRRNLRWSNGPFEHRVIELEPLSLPQPGHLSAWQAEIRLIRALAGELSEHDADSLLDSRLAQLHSLAAPSASGFFWSAPDGQSLRLNPTFAFFDVEREMSEGDVIYTIAWTLELMRAGPKPELVRTTGHHAVIAPAMFDRFNDGIIQAAILRQALPHELFYAASPDHSTSMGDILVRVMTNAEGAAFEFLVSLACGRLRLMPVDLARVCAAARALPDPAPMLIRRLYDVPGERLSLFD